MLLSFAREASPFAFVVEVILALIHQHSNQDHADMQVVPIVQSLCRLVSHLRAGSWLASSKLLLMKGHLKGWMKVLESWEWLSRTVVEPNQDIADERLVMGEFVSWAFC